MRKPIVSDELAHLEVVRLDRRDWRVSDATLGQDDPRRLLGFIERLKRSHYEVVCMTQPIEWAYTATFEQALAALEGLESFAGIRLLNRDESVMTSSPPSGPARRRTKSDA